METLVLSLFVAGLILCVVSGFSVIAALLWGLLLFSFYAYKKGTALRCLRSFLTVLPR